jgi:hypothetical protein
VVCEIGVLFWQRAHVAPIIRLCARESAHSTRHAGTCVVHALAFTFMHLGHTPVVSVLCSPSVCCCTCPNPQHRHPQLAAVGNLQVQVRVQVAMHGSSSDEGASESDNRSWTAMEDAVISQSSGRHLVFIAARKHQNPFTAAFTDEAIRVNIVLMNPLAVPLALKNLRLACIHVRNADSIAAPDVPPFSEALDQNLPALRTRAAASDAAAGTMVMDITIGPRETKPLVLELKPRQEGWIKIEGLRWEVSLPGGSMEGGEAVGVADAEANAETLCIPAACFWAPQSCRRKCACHVMLVLCMWLTSWLPQDVSALRRLLDHRCLHQLARALCTSIRMHLAL